MDFDISFHPGFLLSVAWTLGVSYFIRIVVKGWRVRKFHVELRKQNLVSEVVMNTSTSSV